MCDVNGLGGANDFEMLNECGGNEIVFLQTRNLSFQEKQKCFQERTE